MYVMDLEVGLNLNKMHLMVILITVIFSILLFFIFFVLMSYLCIKMFQVSFHYNNIFFQNYNKKSQQIVDKYGKCIIKNVYISRQPFGHLLTFLLNILTVFQYQKITHDSSSNIPYHIAFIIELECGPETGTKLILLEKNYCINICDNFTIYNKYDLKKLKGGIRNMRFEELLDNTIKSMGADKFFNWEIYDNNCQQFSKHLLSSLGLCTKKNMDYIRRDKLLKLYKPNDISLHIFNCVFFFVNFFEKYILDNNIFN